MELFYFKTKRTKCLKVQIINDYGDDADASINLAELNLTGYNPGLKTLDFFEPPNTERKYDNREGK